jgi:subtilisin-like proprotein convertase family protein
MIPDHGAATPYPSTITVAGLTGQVTKATVTLNGFAHSFPHDVSVLLGSPSGTNVLVMSHAGGGHAVNNLMLTFDDAATGLLPNSNPLTSGTNRPSIYEGPVALPGTGPYSLYQYALSAMDGSDPNGSWSLYVFDDTVGDAGVIASGWTLDLTTAPTLPTISVPTTLSGVFTNGHFQLTVACQPGFVYVLQGSTNLMSWVSLTTNTNTTGSFTFTDATTPAPQQRYYRTLRQ